MTDTIPSLWPEDFKIDVQSPLAILRVQATALSKATRGILRGDVETETGTETVRHRLVVIAPAYNGYRHTLLAVTHKVHFPYPAEVDSYQPSMFGTNPFAGDDVQLQQHVADILRSDHTRGIITSLIVNST